MGRKGGRDIGRRGGWKEEEEKKRGLLLSLACQCQQETPFLPSFLPPPYIVACSEVPLLPFPKKSWGDPTRKGLKT